MKNDKNYRFRALALNPLVLIVYGIICYYIYSLLQYGGLKRKVPFILAGIIILIIWFIWCIFKYRRKSGESTASKQFKIWYFMALFILILTTVTTGANVYKSGRSFNGKLSWFIQDLKNKRKIKFSHNNIYHDGLDGIFQDIKKKIDLPEELYLSNEFRLKFNSKGEVSYLYSYLYGKDKKGESQSFLISYDVRKSEDIIVYLNGQVNENYDDRKKLQAFIDLMKWVPLEESVQKWNQEEYGILYAGVRSWGYNRDGIIYINENSETREISIAEEEIIGHTLSLYVPNKEDTIMPIRYIHDGIKILPEDEKGEEWNIGYSYNDGEESYFLNKDLGYQLSVVDAALGSRFYALLKTQNGGHTWETINSDPFSNNTGLSSGITFIDKKLGFIGLSHSGGIYGELYRTDNGGLSFEELSIPEIEVSLSESETYMPFDFPEMPYEENGRLFLLVGQGQDGDYKGGIKAMYKSKDNGKTWEYVKEVK